MWGVHNACGRPASVALARCTGALGAAEATDPCAPCNGAISRCHGGGLARQPAGAAATRLAAVAEPAAAVERDGACRAVAAAARQAAVAEPAAAAVAEQAVVVECDGTCRAVAAARCRAGVEGTGCASARPSRRRGAMGASATQKAAGRRLGQVGRGGPWLQGRGGRGGGGAYNLPHTAAPAWLARLI